MKRWSMSLSSKEREPLLFVCWLVCLVYWISYLFLLLACLPMDEQQTQKAQQSNTLSSRKKVREIR
jgi:hypothetical protein